MIYFLADRIEILSGIKPKFSVLAELIQKKFREIQVKNKPELEPEKKSSRKPLLLKVKNQNSKSGGEKQSSITIRLNEMEFTANSVREFYFRILQYIVDNKFIDSLESYIPYKTSKKRYLISHEPFHQRGNPFKVPVEYKGYYLEAHKDYNNAFNSLRSFLKKGNLFLERIS